jgi:hypothetical protein
MLDSKQREQAIQLFLNQHAMLHSAKMSQTETWSFEDEVLANMTDEQMRLIPKNGEHSITWLIWHMARCEDITMNLLVADRAQVLLRENWLEKLGITVRDSGNEMDAESLAQFSSAVKIEALRAYRLAVGRGTREMVRQLEPVDLKEKVKLARLQRVRNEGAVVDAAGYILNYWAGRNVAGLLLMPATRHNLIHLNEALEIKKKLK